MKKGINEVIKALKRHNNFLITSHINMEGDAIGSQLAMADILKRLGKRYIIVDNDPIPPAFNFLLGKEKVKTSLSKSDRFDSIISLDCPVIERTGRIARYFEKAKLVINIDHHVSNSNFGDVVWIEPDISSCGEMLYHIYKKLGFRIDRRAALNMYVAIVTDTGYFAYENTTYKTHRITSALLRSGIKPLWVARHLSERKTVNDLRLLNETLKTLKLYFDGKVAILHTSREMLKKFGLRPEDTEGFVNYARSLKTVQIAVFLLEMVDSSGEVHVSFRSKGDVDVNKLASVFNGGGHHNASGCVIKGTLEEAKKIILSKIKKYLG